MASPFKVFRKNQKMALALLTVLTMFAFLFLPMFGDLLGLKSGGPKNEVVVKTTKFGNLMASDVDQLSKKRLRVLSVMTTLMESAQIPPQTARRYFEQKFGPATDDAVIATWLMAHHAQQLGIVLSNDAINNFLEEETMNRVTSDRMQEIFQHAGLSAGQFFGLLREELLALKAQEVFKPSLLAATPGERWEYFNRIYRNATIEAVAVPVADYVGKVATPTEDDLKKFFEEHKEQIAVPESPEPGFHQPQRIALHYIRADVDKFADPKTVTDQQVRERYEKDKDKYDQYMERIAPKKPAAEPEKKPAEPVKKGPAAQPAKSAEPSKLPPAPPKAPEPSKDEPKKPPAGKVSVNTEKRPATAVAGVSAPRSLPATAVAGRLEDIGVLTASAGESPFRLTAFAEEKAEPTVVARSPDRATPPQTALAVEPVPAARSGDRATTPGAATLPKPAADAKPQPPKTGLTDELKDSIRRELAQEKIMLLLDDMAGQISDYRVKWEPYHLDEIRNKALPPDQRTALASAPPEPEFEKFAQQNGLSAGRTPLEPYWELKGSEIGDSQQFAFVTDAQGVRRPQPGPLVYQYAYQSLSLFRAEKSMGLKSSLFLFWKTDEEKDHVPKFEDPGIRVQVLRSWKLMQARDIALKAAETLAAEARKANKSLKFVFAEQPQWHVIMPSKFTWLNFANVAQSWQQPARLSAVDGVDMPGWDFMRKVFGLEPGQVGVAFNAPKTVVYVVRPTQFTPSYEALRAQFEAEPFGKYAMASVKDYSDRKQAWLEAMKKSAGFEWGPGHKAEHPSERPADRAPVGEDEDY